MVCPASDGKLGDFANTGDLAARQIAIEIAQVLFQLRQCLALRQVIGKLLEVPEPHASVLPVDVTRGDHETILLLYRAGSGVLGPGIAGICFPGGQGKLKHAPPSVAQGIGGACFSLPVVSPGPAPV